MRVFKLLVIFAVLALPVSALAAVPQLVSYQGRLTDTAGDALDTTVAITFTLYDAPTLGAVIWSETQATVTTVDGIFTVLLGSVVTLTDVMFSDSSRYLALQVGGDPELTPRVRLVSGPYAFRVATVDGASGGIISGDVSIQSDLIVSGKAAIGPGVTNTGLNAYSAGQNNTAGGNNSTVSGGSDNSADSAWATVGGGFLNTANGRFANVGGGTDNTASGASATVGGGSANSAGGLTSTISGGRFNISGGDYATVGGGQFSRALGRYSVVAGGGGPNSADSNQALGEYSSIGGGSRNTASGDYSTVSGGIANTASGFFFATVGGGVSNTASGTDATVGGGTDNTASGPNSTIPGGSDNGASGEYATVSGGIANSASSQASTVGGGDFNRASNLFSTVSGGVANTASGESATVPGGVLNSATGDYSFAAGRRSKANHDGTFVWGDNTNADFASTGANQFLIRASGGVGIGTNTPLARLHIKGAGFPTSFGYFDTESTSQDAGLRFYEAGTIKSHLYHQASTNTLNLYGEGFSGLSVTSTGSVGVGTNTPNYKLDVRGSIGNNSTLYHSDRRWKHNITTLTNSLDRVQLLRGVSYEWKRHDFTDMNFPEGIQIGLIAQEVEHVLPEVVNTNSAGYKSVDYSKLVALLIEASKEQQKQIDELQKMVNQLVSATQTKVTVSKK